MNQIRHIWTRYDTNITLATPLSHLEWYYRAHFKQSVDTLAWSYYSKYATFLRSGEYCVPEHYFTWDEQLCRKLWAMTMTRIKLCFVCIVIRLNIYYIRRGSIEKCFFSFSPKRSETWAQMNEYITVDTWWFAFSWNLTETREAK